MNIFIRETLFWGVKQILPNEQGSIINNNVYFKKKNRQFQEIKKPSYNLYFKKFKENIIDHSISDKKIALSLSSVWTPQALLTLYIVKKFLMI